MRSGIESLIKLPLQIPIETSVRSKDTDAKHLTNKPEQKIELAEIIDETIDKLKVEMINYSKGYIKYPAYDYF